MTAPKPGWLQVFRRTWNGLLTNQVRADLYRRDTKQSLVCARGALA